MHTVTPDKQEKNTIIAHKEIQIKKKAKYINKKQRIKDKYKKYWN